MPSSKSGQAPLTNPIALPAGQLCAAATKYFNNNNGEQSQMQKALEVGSYFLSGCMAVNISQFLGAPLYLINEDWYNAWIALTKQSFGLLTTTLTQYWAPTVVRVSGDKSVRGQIISTGAGGLRCFFPQRLVLISNHQIYTDWLYLWWIAYCNGAHGRIFIVLKESLRQIPVIGWGMRFSQFIFLKRNWELDKPRMARHFQKLNKLTLPMWLVIFPEGTNLADSTRERSAKWAKENGIQDLQHTLLPRSTGLRFSLQQMRETVKYVYDCTIAYEGVPRGEYAQDIFTVKTAYFEGQPPKSVNMYWRRFALSSIPIDDPVAFEVWLRARWMEKDGLIEAYHRYGRFPADRGAHKTREGRIIRGAGHIEAEVKSDSWYEFLQIFAPVGLFVLVLYMFYNALPKTYTDSLNRQNVIKQAEGLQNTQISLQKQQLLTHSGSTASTGQDSLLAKAMTIYTDLSKSPVVRKVVQLPELSPKGLTNEITKHQPAFDTMLTQKNALRDLKTKLPASLAEMPPSMAPSRTNGQRTVNDSETNHVKTQPKQLATTVSPRKQAKINAPNGFGTNDLQVHNPVFKPLESKKIESKKVSEITRQSTPRKEAQNKMPQQIGAQHKPVFSAQNPASQPKTSTRQPAAATKATGVQPSVAKKLPTRQAMPMPKPAPGKLTVARSNGPSTASHTPQGKTISAKRKATSTTNLVAT